MCLQCRSLPLPLTPASDPTAVNSTCATTLRSRPSNLYGSFIRFESISLKDATQTQYPALAFSAKFAYVLFRSLHLEAVTPDRDPLHRMTSMTGVFTAEILSQIAGQSTAPLASQTSAAVASTTAQASTTNASKSSSSTASSTKASASSTSTASSATGVRVGWAAIALSALIGVSMF